MNNLHRELAPISDVAWSDLEDEARRTFAEFASARKVVDVVVADDATLSAVGTGHVEGVDSPLAGVTTRLRTAQRIVDLKVPFTVTREAVDSVEWGAKDPDWQPVKDAAQAIAYAEDRIVFDGFAGAGITGIRPASSLNPVALPAEASAYPKAIGDALAKLRAAGVAGPYSVLLSNAAYTAAIEAADHGYPVLEHLKQIVDGDLILTPAIEGACVLTTRGGDYELHFGQDLSIGYTSHDADSVQLYFRETLTFLVNTAEAAVGLTA
ncbi:family 1 encapsulin nanocompartment shell protein [Amycolatopsis rhabdoformis]|uniref:Type 1 encapsulin shell protein n=1 Tax=Amycolatopsis rhabdoformis TaxID=1448059 RepID=A0ABZ1I0D7_9PSEU|nr:family 1 encapsulin nanocompartment shell protein [Amycolatopsis rhabdoformis]WSE27109.1 family 1 encapsulin nanocompartment shell protein [Amycolatopsis rhabdoformis]